jgi:hypothetical protein
MYCPSWVFLVERTTSGETHQTMIVVRRIAAAALAICGLLLDTSTGLSADLGAEPTLPQPAPPLSQWQFSFTPYLWLPWMTGDVVVKGRTLDVAVDPAQLIDHLDWSDIVPAWFSHAEARRGPLSLFNDVVWADVSGSGGFQRKFNGKLASGTFGADIDVNYQLAIVEAGGAYTVWSQGRRGSPGSTAFDVLAGARWWHQEIDVSADLTTTLTVGGPDGLTISGNRAIAKSGGIDWVDPFVGARVQHQLAPGQAIEIRGDVGGFGAGSQFSWQAIATYNRPLCMVHGIPVDGYLGFRALSADFSQGSGQSRFEWDNVIYGPVIGATMRF